MIQLHCTQCQQLLEMDEGFAGGVCRCQYCGTIQTVPKTKPASGKASPKPQPTKALYKKSTTPGGSQAGAAPAPAGTGLDELAEIVASSGLARGSLSKAPKRAPADTTVAADVADAAPTLPPAKRNAMLAVLIGSGVVIVVLLGLVLYFAFRSPPAPQQTGTGTSGATNSANPSNAANSPDGTGEAPVAPAGPSFAGIPLPGSSSVVYLLDRGQASTEVIEALKVITYKSATSLGGDRKFQIIFWQRPEEGMVAYPEAGLSPATAGEIAVAKQRFEDVVAYGKTDLKPTVEKALASKPDVLVIATAKESALDDDAATQVLDLLRKSKTTVTVHTLSLGEFGSPALKQIAEQSGGQYREIHFNQLQSLAN